MTRLGLVKLCVLDRLLLMRGGHTGRFNHIKTQQKIELQHMQMYGIG